MSESQKLAPSEIEILKVYMKKYREFYEKVEGLSTKVEEVDKIKAELIEQIQTISIDLEKLRLEEDDFQKTLIAKYGEFHINLETFEIKPA
jgi:hypothetical protein